MRSFLVLSLLVLAGCQDPCNASTCVGCCGADGTCLEGKADDACGTRGAECAVCASGSYCVNAACLELDVDAGVVDSGTPCACAGSCCLADGGCAGSNDSQACGGTMTWCAPCGDGLRCEGGACVSQSCAGCFDPLGNCHAGSEHDACGVGGGVCQSCGSDQECANNVCHFTHCGADNCRFGCCQADNTCVTSTSVAACGTNGNACAVCGGSTQCLNGSCQ